MKRARLRTLAISVGLDLLGCQTWRRGIHKGKRGKLPLLQGEGRDRKRTAFGGCKLPLSLPTGASRSSADGDPPSFHEGCKAQEGTWRAKVQGGTRKAKVEEGQSAHAWRKGHARRRLLQQEGQGGGRHKEDGSPQSRAMNQRHCAAAHAETGFPQRGAGPRQEAHTHDGNIPTS